LALPHIIKHIYNNGSEEVIRRGKKINGSGFVELIENDDLMASIVFRVKDDSYATFYKVYIQKYIDPKLMSLRCSCPYNIGDICRHEAAALFRLQDMVDKNMLGSNLIQHNQYHTVAKMKHIDLKTIKMLCSPTIYEEADNMMRAHKATILKSVDERVEAELKINGFVYPLVIQKNDERNFDTSCTCAETMHPLCEHKVLLFLQLLNAFGANYFDSIRNWDKEKNKLLQIYGYTLNDDLTGKFEFSYKEGKPFLKLLDPSIKRVAQQPVQETKSSIQNVNYTKTTVQTVVAEKPITKKKLGLVINFNQQNFPGLLFDAVYGEANEEHNKFVGKVEAIDLTKYVNTELFDDADKYFFSKSENYNQRK
jgi:non-specific serine/threonine protein kinase